VIPLKDDIPTRRFPVLTVAIIVINVVMFFGFQHGRITFTGNAVSNKNVVEYGAIPYEITHPGKQCVMPQENPQVIACDGEKLKDPSTGQVARLPDNFAESQDKNLPPTWLTIFTAMFMHGGLLHIAGNMLFLWIFGNNIEDSMGRPRFVAFYLLGGIAALLGQVLVHPSSTTPTIGASGAIAAVLGGYALLYPRARVVTLVIIIIFVTIIELPALIVLGGWFLLQALYGAAEATQPVAGGGGVAYFAHIGGFLFGLLTIRLFANKVQEDYEASHRPPVY
jgi:rhomboid family protein